MPRNFFREWSLKWNLKPEIEAIFKYDNNLEHPYQVNSCEQTMTMGLAGRGKWELPQNDR